MHPVQNGCLEKLPKGNYDFAKSNACLICRAFIDTSVSLHKAVTE